MESKKEKFTGNSGHGRHARREKKERERESYFSSAADKGGKTGIKKQCKVVKRRSVFCCLGVISVVWGGRARRSDNLVGEATLCGVFVVEELGLTVGEDLNLRRIWTLTDPGCHESIQVLQTRHLPSTQEVIG